MQRHVSIPVGQEFVTGELFLPTAAVKSLMLMCHGWTSKNQKYLKLAQSLSDLGILTLAINMRGHGDSTYSLVNYSRKNHLDDIIAAIDYLKELHPNKQFILMGKSYGGYLCAIASSMRKIDYLILSQPALYPDKDFTVPTSRLIKQNPNIFRDMSQLVTSNKALHSISHFEKPILIVESEHDEEVMDTPKLYIAASCSNPNRDIFMVKNSDHPLSRSEWLEDYYAGIIDWIENKMIPVK